jgi:alanine racemase
VTDSAGLGELRAMEFDPNMMEIDLGAIAGNFREFRRRLAAGRRMIGVIKADAYGHGAVEIARTLSALGVDFLASGSLKESVGVRRAGISTPIILLGSLSPEAIHDAIHHGAIPSVDSMAIAEELSRATTTPLSVFVKVDCGFGRFGIPITRAVAFVEHVLSLPHLKIEGIYTHLPFSDEQGRDWAQRQTLVFDRLIAALAARGLAVPIAQSQASAGLSVGLADDGTATAIGHLLYGLSPVNAELAAASATPILRPGLKSVKAKLIHVGEPPEGATAAPYLRGHYGRLGVVSIGIQHGYRPTSNAARMIICGSEVPLLRVCLENTIVDLSHAIDAQVGDQVIVVGTDGHISITLQDLAKWQATSQLALLTNFGKSLTRTYTVA